MVQHLNSFRSIRFHLALVSVVAWLIGASLLPSETTAQYKSDPVKDISQRDKNGMRNQVRKMIRGADFDAAVFNAWYTELALPEMTSNNDLALGQIAERRRTIISDLASSTSDEVRRKLINAIHKKTREVAAANYHPSVQYNFIYLLGLLNDQEAKPSQRKPPVPHAPAYQTLLKIAASSKQSDVAKLAALLGLQRHVELKTKFSSVAGQLPVADKQNTFKVLNQIVASPPAKESDQSGRDWLRTIAAETLGTLGNPAAIPNVTRLIKNPKIGLSARCAGARALGQLDISKSGIDGSKFMKPVAQLSADCCSDVVSTFGRLPKSEGGEQSLLDDDEHLGSDFDPATVPARRRLLSYMVDVRASLVGNDDGESGLSKFAPNAAKPLLDEVDATIAGLKNPQVSAIDLKNSISQHEMNFKNSGK